MIICIPTNLKINSKDGTCKKCNSLTTYIKVHNMNSLAVDLFYCNSCNVCAICGYNMFFIFQQNVIYNHCMICFHNTIIYD